MRRNNEIIEIIDLKRQEKQLSISELARRVGMAKSALSRYFNGTREFPLNRVEDFAKALDVSSEYLLGFDENSNSNNSIEKIYSQLSPPRQQKVYDFAKNELEEQQNQINHSNENDSLNLSISEAIDDLQDEPTETVNINLIAAAGYGTLNFEKEKPIETVVLPQNTIPAHYDYACKISGNSMEPMFHDDEVIFLKKTFTVKNNMIAAIEINKNCYLKKLTLDRNRLRLISLNNETDNNGNLLYPDIFAEEGDEIYIIGEVIR